MIKNKISLREKIKQIIDLLHKEFPDMKQKPTRSNPMDVLIATMLSQNTTDKTSYIAFKNLRDEFKNWEAVMNAPLSKIRSAIRVCGLANQKAKNIKMMLKQMNNKYGELNINFIKKLSDESVYEELLQYNGVGTKTAACVLAFGLGRDVFPVDTHVHRISNRLGLVHTGSPEKTFEALKNEIPEGKRFILHTSLIRFGRKVCKAQNPLCGKCILYDVCEFKKKEYYADKTNKAPKENNFIILEHV